LSEVALLHRASWAFPWTSAARKRAAFFFAATSKQEPLWLFFGGIAMEQPGPVSRHRDKNGRIATKHRNTLISTLRLTYGAGFAPKERATSTLGDVLGRLDEPSLAKLIADLPPNER
jgi:hypothetical protein